VAWSVRRGEARLRSTYNEGYARCHLEDDVGRALVVPDLLVIVVSGWSFVVRSLFLFHGVDPSRGLFTSPGGMIPMHVISNITQNEQLR
jgi:hypothetical protein